MNKLFFKSKLFWTGLAGIFTTIGLFVSGEASLEKTLTAIIVGVLGLLTIIFRVGANKKLSFKKNGE